MKSRQKITRVILDPAQREDYLLLGVVSAEPDYKLSLAINRKLKISLKHKNPIETTNDQGISLHFSRFSDHSSDTGLTFNLVCNKSGGEFLLRKLNKIDYFLQVYSPDNDSDKDQLTLSLRSIETITAVFALDTTEIRDKNLQYLIP